MSQPVLQSGTDALCKFGIRALTECLCPMPAGVRFALASGRKTQDVFLGPRG